MNLKKLTNPRPNQWEGKKNPFADDLGVQKESDSDQIQDSYHDTGSGWIPISARDKRPLKFSLWDNMEVPGYSDRSQAWGGDWNGMGTSPSRNNGEQAQWSIFPFHEHTKNKKRHPELDEIDDMDELAEASVNRKIIKISSDDSQWMNETVHQMKNALYLFTDALNKNFRGPGEPMWRFLMPPIKDGNTLMLQWIQGRGLDIKKFILYVRYNAGADTYSASSSLYDSKNNQQTTLQAWSDDVYVETLLDPQIWVRR